MEDINEKDNHKINTISKHSNKTFNISSISSARRIKNLKTVSIESMQDLNSNTLRIDKSNKINKENKENNIDKLNTFNTLNSLFNSKSPNKSTNRLNTDYTTDERLPTLTNKKLSGSKLTKLTPTRIKSSNYLFYSNKFNGKPTNKTNKNLDKNLDRDSNLRSDRPVISLKNVSNENTRNYTTKLKSHNSLIEKLDKDKEIFYPEEIFENKTNNNYFKKHNTTAMIIFNNKLNSHHLNQFFTTQSLEMFDPFLPKKHLTTTEFNSIDSLKIYNDNKIHNIDDELKNCKSRMAEIAKIITVKKYNSSMAFNLTKTKKLVLNTHTHSISKPFLTEGKTTRNKKFFNIDYFFDKSLLNFNKKDSTTEIYYYGKSNLSAFENKEDFIVKSSKLNYTDSSGRYLINIGDHINFRYEILSTISPMNDDTSCQVS